MQNGIQDSDNFRADQNTENFNISMKDIFMRYDPILWGIPVATIPDIMKNDIAKDNLKKNV